MTIGLWGAHHKIRFFNFQETNRVSHVSYQTRIFHTNIRNRAQRGLVDAKISTEINAPLQQQRRPRFKIGRLVLRCREILALAVDQVYLGGHETPIRARKGSGLAEISAMQGVAPPEACRRVSLEIDFSGLRGGANLALAIDQGCLRGPETRIRAGKSSADAEISVLQGRTTHRNQVIHIF